MSLTLFQDRHTVGLLNRIRKDASVLREDIGELLSDTTHRAIPNTAQEIADRAKQQIAAGSAFAASRLRNLKVTPRPAANWVGGAAILGLFALGAYVIHCRNSACQKAAVDEMDESSFDVGGA